MQRKEFEKMLDGGGAVEKFDAVRIFLRDNKKIKDYHYLFKKLQPLAGDCRKTSKVAILSSFTFEQIEKPLFVETFKRGLFSDIYFGGYDQYCQEILQADSALYAFDPDIVVLAIRIEELFPDFDTDFLKLDPDRLDAELQNIIGLFDNLITALRKNTNSRIVINNFSYPSFLESGVHDFQNPDGQLASINRLNARLVELTNRFTDTLVFDFNYYMYEFGGQRALDARMWFTAKIPYGPEFIAFLAEKYGQFINATFGRKKCLVVDLDNTLWGGIVSEDGVGGIVLGHNHPGNVYCEIQKVIKKYANQGVILAINSKNNLGDAKEVFDDHPDMILKWDDFAAVRVNWNPKPENMVELAEEINIGLEDFVFIDDNPFEAEMVMRVFPETAVVQFGEDALKNLSLLKGLDYFQNPYLSESDIKKGAQYKAQAKARRFKSSVDNIEDFYLGLDMKLEICLCDALALKRVAQLTQKTNQFNLTTKRYSESDIERLMDANDFNVYLVSLKDKFGDNGITGVGIIEEVDKDWHIDTFLLSCRIIGRTVETAFLSFLQRTALEQGIERLIGVYRETPKNALVKDFYQDHGFNENEGTWALNTSTAIAPPEWIALSETPEPMNDVRQRGTI